MRGDAGASAVRLLRSRDDRLERRRRHVRVSRGLRRVRRRGGFRHAAVRPAAATPTNGSCCRWSARSWRLPGRSSASTANRSTLRCSRRGICSTVSSGAAAASRTSTCSIRPAASGARAAGAAPCSLAALEQSVLGARRSDDVPGFEIPARYFQFVRSGDARPLVGVLEHNRLDLLSLAGLTARLLDLVRTGPGAARHPREALALGACTHGAASRRVRARPISALSACARRAEASESTVFARWPLLSPRGAVATRMPRRAGASCSQSPDVRAHLAREASEALAVHHEHRARDLQAAQGVCVAESGRQAGNAGGSAHGWRGWRER